LERQGKSRPFPRYHSTKNWGLISLNFLGPYPTVYQTQANLKRITAIMVRISLTIKLGHNELALLVKQARVIVVHQRQVMALAYGSTNLEKKPTDLGWLPHLGPCILFQFPLLHLSFLKP